MKRSSFIIISAILILVFLSLFKAVLSNVLSTSGVELSAIDKAIQGYKKENSILKQKLYEQMSITNIALKASELGFGEIKSQLVLTTDSSVITSSLPLFVKQ